MIDGAVVRIIAEAGVKLDIPRRQSFAWSKNAEAYARSLAAERGWKVHQVAHASR